MRFRAAKTSGAAWHVGLWTLKYVNSPTCLGYDLHPAVPRVQRAIHKTRTDRQWRTLPTSARRKQADIRAPCEGVCTSTKVWWGLEHHADQRGKRYPNRGNKEPQPSLQYAAESTPCLQCHVEYAVGIHRNPLGKEGMLGTERGRGHTRRNSPRTPSLNTHTSNSAEFHPTCRWMQQATQQNTGTHTSPTMFLTLSRDSLSSDSCPSLSMIAEEDETKVSSSS